MVFGGYDTLLKKRLSKEQAEAEFLDAAKIGLLEDVQHLWLVYEDDIDINVLNQKQQSPLHLAVKKGHLNIVAYLLGHGADPNTEGFMRYTPLHYAALYNHLPIVKLLIENNAELDPNNDHGYPPREYAASTEISEYLEQAIFKQVGFNF